MVKLEEGKYYRTRDGRKAGPLYLTHGNTCMRGFVEGQPNLLRVWNLRGEHFFNQTEIDLVAEWVEETTMDIYSLEKPLGMYPKEVLEALVGHVKSGGKVQAWGGWGWAFCEKPAFILDLTYRAVKKPEVVEVTVHVGPNPTPMGAPWLFGMGGKTVVDTHKITFNLVDGVPDCNSIKMEKL
jgi:hypothetical protein